MKLLIALALIVLAIIPSRAQDWLSTDDAPPPFVVKLNESSRQFRNTGTITLRHPIYGFVLGTYQFVTGGFGRGSAPFGVYEIGNFRNDGWIGPRWELHRPGFHPRRGFSAFDRRIRKMRTWLQLHSMHGMNKGTFGCIGVFGGRRVWSDFVAHVRLILGLIGHVQFILGK